MVKVALVSVALLVGGCANMTEYYKSVDTTNIRQVEAAKAQAEADAARYNALARIAESGNESAKVAATMALALGGSQSRPMPLAIPAVPQNEALQWASILAPTVTNLGMAWFNKQVQINNSNNSRAISEAQIGKDVQLGLGAQQTYLGFAKEINDPTVVTNTVEKAVIVNPQVVNPVVVQPTVVNPVVVQPNVITVGP